MTTLPMIFRPPGKELKLPSQPVRVIGIDLGATKRPAGI